LLEAAAAFYSSHVLQTACAKRACFGNISARIVSLQKGAFKEMAT